MAHTKSLCLLICLLLTLAFWSGCAATASSKRAEVPKWLTSVPKDEVYFYAVGMSGQTRKAGDAWNQAAQRGRAELGKTIITHITTTDTSFSTERSDYTRQVIEAISDTELQFTEVIERWHDRNGDYGPPNHYYVLVRMDKKRADKILRGIK